MRGDGCAGNWYGGALIQLFAFLVVALRLELLVSFPYLVLKGRLSPRAGASRHTGWDVLSASLTAERHFIQHKSKSFEGICSLFNKVKAVNV